MSETALEFMPEMSESVRMEAVILFINENLKERFNIKFKEPVLLPINKVIRKELISVSDVGFFNVKDTLCYTKSKGKKVHGFPVTLYFPLDKVEKLEIILIDEKRIKSRRAKVLAKQIAENTMLFIKENLMKNALESYPEANFRPIYYAVRFPITNRETLRKSLSVAFATQSPFEYEYKSASNRGNARDLKIKLGYDENGNYSGELTSSYPGTENGDRFIILSEKVAFFTGNK